MAARRNWTREEHILAFNLYCKIPFGTIHMRNPKVIELAKLLGRTVGAVSYKLANFARLDPSLRARGIKGMPHGSGGESEVWREFESDPEALAFESECLLARLSGRKLEDIAEIDEEELPKEGLERERMVRTRVNQHFFRQAVLSAYDYKCCITDLAVPELLIASHIVPWAVNKAQRMNPRNGLCLNALHDRAFDRKLMFIDEDFKVRFRKPLVFMGRRSSGLDWLLGYEGKEIAT
ncbi:MAG TPA: HNH endonuclease signature motif containing protein, partial [Verrucomicrobiota bacterium]|nr:HNH endonuclease signature motif containing protein [Verrucomicrobiota bacterium]